MAVLYLPGVWLHDLAHILLRVQWPAACTPVGGVSQWIDTQWSVLLKWKQGVVVNKAHGCSYCSLRFATGVKEIWDHLKTTHQCLNVCMTAGRVNMQLIFCLPFHPDIQRVCCRISSTTASNSISQTHTQVWVEISNVRKVTLLSICITKSQVCWPWNAHQRSRNRQMYECARFEASTM